MIDVLVFFAGVAVGMFIVFAMFEPIDNAKEKLEK